eukprot:TRINITY_DN2106_c0_g1_i1.p1 TRINITY_DN2106_c0_g1~~TRINITY_DN2106_c0_g1_i1.p1  ORF type:complete len:705 (-),score=185.54 TRINITY_DN2106_c0_g1_i1:1019-3133(-)
MNYLINKVITYQSPLHLHTLNRSHSKKLRSQKYRYKRYYAQEPQGDEEEPITTGKQKSQETKRKKSLFRSITGRNRYSAEETKKMTQEFQKQQENIGLGFASNKRISDFDPNEEDDVDNLKGEDQSPRYRYNEIEEKRASHFKRLIYKKKKKWSFFKPNDPTFLTHKYVAEEWERYKMFSREREDFSISNILGNQYAFSLQSFMNYMKDTPFGSRTRKNEKLVADIRYEDEDNEVFNSLVDAPISKMDEKEEYILRPFSECPLGLMNNGSVVIDKYLYSFNPPASTIERMDLRTHAWETLFVPPNLNDGVEGRLHALGTRMLLTSNSVDHDFAILDLEGNLVEKIPSLPETYGKLESIVFTIGEDIYILWCPGYGLPGYAHLYDYNTFGQDPNLIPWRAVNEQKVEPHTERDISFQAPYSKIYKFDQERKRWNEVNTKGMSLPRSFLVSVDQKNNQAYFTSQFGVFKFDQVEEKIEAIECKGRPFMSYGSRTIFNNDKIYFIGGDSVYDGLEGYEIYVLDLNKEEKEWVFPCIDISELEFEKWLGGLTKHSLAFDHINNRILIIGGENYVKNTTEVWELVEPQHAKDHPYTPQLDEIEKLKRLLLLPEEKLKDIDINDVQDEEVANIIVPELDPEEIKEQAALLEENEEEEELTDEIHDSQYTYIPRKRKKKSGDEEDDEDDEDADDDDLEDDEADETESKDTK